MFVFYCVYIRIKVRHAYKLFSKLLLRSIIETWNYISDFIKFFCRPLSFTRDIKTCQVGNIMPTYKNGWQLLQFTIILRIVFVTSSFQMITMFLANPYSLLCKFVWPLMVLCDPDWYNKVQSPLIVYVWYMHMYLNVVCSFNLLKSMVFFEVLYRSFFVLLIRKNTKIVI